MTSQRNHGIIKAKLAALVEAILKPKHTQKDQDAKRVKFSAVYEGLRVQFLSANISNYV